MSFSVSAELWTQTSPLRRRSIDLRRIITFSTRSCRRTWTQTSAHDRIAQYKHERVSVCVCVTSRASGEEQSLCDVQHSTRRSTFPEQMKHRQACRQRFSVPSACRRAPRVSTHTRTHAHRHRHTETCTHTHTHTHTRTHAHTDRQRQTHTHTHACAHRQTDTHTHAHTQTDRDTHTDRHTHTHTHTDRHTHTHTHTDRHTHRQTHTHTHRQTQTETDTHTHRQRHTHTHTHRAVNHSRLWAAIFILMQKRICQQ